MQRKLFEEQERLLERRIRRQRALFIPHLLRNASSSALLRGERQDAAYKTIEHWAELETRGDLKQYRETAVDTQFLDQIFGVGLGYRVKTASPDAWELEHKFSVKEVGIADAALGAFTPQATEPTVMVELKDPQTDLDRDRSNGRTAVQQCWDYLNASPNATWGIVSNLRTIRLYHRDKGTLAYEEFTLQELTDRDRFNDFYYLFQRDGLLPSAIGQQARAVRLLEQTAARQREVGDDLYKSYQVQRLELIEHLKLREDKSLDEAIRIAQKILDRIIFIAFCEDRGLLPENSLESARREIRTYSRAKNPAWENFLDLFAAVDKGAQGRRSITAFNGGLFADDPAINALELVAEKWTTGFAGFGKYDFSEEVNVEVLGHLFERSVTELEKLRVGGLLALKSGVDEPAEPAPAKRGKKRAAPATELPESKMPKSAQRKRFGIYYTPPAFTGLIVERTIDAIVAERYATLQKQHKVDPDARKDQNPKKLLAYWQAAFDALRSITVCDPACGSGAFLIRAYDALEAHYTVAIHGLAGAGLSEADITRHEDEVPDWILNHNLFGVDLSEQAVEITQLALWIRSARKGRKLSDLSQHIKCGNSLVSDRSVDPRALDWRSAFPTIFGRQGAGGFTCVIGNPPWERVKLEEREFFLASAPQIAMTANAADRKRLIEELEGSDPELWELYRKAQDSASRMLDYVRSEEAAFPLTGKGDVNLYMLFAELAQRIVAPAGRVGLLLPSGIATDHTTQEYFGSLVKSKRLSAIYDFVNRLGLFPDVEGRLKFCVLLFGGEEVQSESMDFVFWAERMEDVAIKSRHIALTARDIELMNPNTRTCPIFRSERDADVTKHVYRNVPILIDLKRKKGGNPWEIRFLRMFDQTNDASLFGEAASFEKEGYALEGNIYTKGKKRALPLIEAKMTREYDHRASWVTMNRNNAYMNYSAESVSLVDHQNPEFLPKGRYWVQDEHVHERAPVSLHTAAIGFHDVARANDTRTMVPCLVPYAAYSNTIPLILNDGAQDWRRFCCLAGNLNAYVCDYVVRQKIGGAHLNFFIVEQIPVLSPNVYDGKCPWNKRESLEHWISERVLKLTCTAEDMIPLAQACDFAGSRGDGVHIWKEDERRQLCAELDAAFFHLYGVEQDDVEYILSTFNNTGLVDESEKHQEFLWQRGSTGELILEAFDRMNG
ncbi:MAG: N-6 DNA methylase [Planctomycetes bacterium]|nr:N-6 DNA methylase [Planctomycetota bacterium]